MHRLTRRDAAIPCTHRPRFNVTTAALAALLGKDSPTSRKEGQSNGADGGPGAEAGVDGDGEVQQAMKVLAGMYQSAAADLALLAHRWPSCFEGIRT